MLTGKSETASGMQSIQNDSCICYTDKQDKNCLECLINKPKKDSIIQIQALQIINFKDVVRNDNEQKSLLINQAEDLKKSLNIANKKVDFWRKLSKYGLPVGIIGGAFLGYSLAK